MLPERCSIREKGKDCPMPPEFIISIRTEKDEYMVGLTCSGHKEAVFEKLKVLQKDGKIPDGKIQFTGVRAVGTDCIRMDSNEFIQL